MRAQAYKTPFEGSSMAVFFGLCTLLLCCVGLPLLAQDKSAAATVPAVAPAPVAAGTQPAIAGSVDALNPGALPRPSSKVSVSGIQSILFRNEDANKIRRALEIYRRSLQPVAVIAPVKNKEEEDFLSKIAKGLQTTAAQIGGAPGMPQMPKMFDYPKFYMESMIHYAENNWAVWMSGKKYTTFKPIQGEIEVTRFSSTSVTFIWRPADMAPLVEAYDKRLDHDANVIVDEIKGGVEFTLSPNQTFYSDQMKIVEGKYFAAPAPAKPAVDASVKPSGNAPPLTTGTTVPASGGVAPPGAPAAEAPPGSNQGLQGLQNMYNGQIQQNIKAAQ